MNATKSQSPSKSNWILRTPNQEPLENPKLRLLCIPHAGSGAFVYQSWNGHLPDGVEVLPVEVPGRNTRRQEPPPPSLAQFAKDFVDALGPDYLSESSTVPYVLFGHSLGAWMAYAIVQELQQRNSGSSALGQKYTFPVALIVSGTRSPNLAGVEYDPDGVEMHTLDAPQFWEIFEKRYGKNPDLADPHVREFFRPRLQSDFKLGETYRPLENITDLLPCPLFVSVGAQDPRCVNKESVAAWKECCENTNMCQVRYFPGGHHYLVNEEESKNAFLKYLSEILNRSILGESLIVEQQGQENEEEEVDMGMAQQENVASGGGGGNGGGSIKSMSSDAGATVASDSTYGTAGISRNRRGSGSGNTTRDNSEDDGGGNYHWRTTCCCF